MTDKFIKLEAYRQRKDWTYRQLADVIATETKRRRDPDCWRKICQGVTTAPHARTLAILDEFFLRRRVS